MMLYKIRNKATVHADSFSFYAIAPDLSAALKLMPACLCGDRFIPGEVELLTEDPLIDPQYLGSGS